MQQARDGPPPRRGRRDLRADEEVSLRTAMAIAILSLLSPSLHLSLSVYPHCFFQLVGLLVLCSMVEVGGNFLLLLLKKKTKKNWQDYGEFMCWK